MEVGVAETTRASQWMGEDTLPRLRYISTCPRCPVVLHICHLAVRWHMHHSCAVRSCAVRSCVVRFVSMDEWPDSLCVCESPHIKTISADLSLGQRMGEVRHRSAIHAVEGGRGKPALPTDSHAAPPVPLTPMVSHGVFNGAMAHASLMCRTWFCCTLRAHGRMT